MRLKKEKSVAKIFLRIVICMLGGVVCLCSSEQYLDSLLEQGAKGAKDNQGSSGQQQEQNNEEESDIQGLKFIQSYYGNPQYQSAMKILNDNALRSQYEQALNDYQLSFFEYTNNVLSDYHAPKTAAAKANVGSASVSVTSFLNSIKNKNSQSSNQVVPQAQSTNQLHNPSQAQSNNSNSANSFLNSLKG